MKTTTALLTTFLILTSNASVASTPSGFSSTTPDLLFSVVPSGSPETQVGDWNATGLTINGAMTSQGKLTGTNGAFNGDVQIGEDDTGCGGSTLGTIRYDGGSGTLQYCNNNGWQAVSSGVPSGTLCGEQQVGFGMGEIFGHNCQGQNPYNGCPGGYYQAVDGIPGNQTYYCIKS